MAMLVLVIEEPECDGPECHPSQGIAEARLKFEAGMMLAGTPKRNRTGIVIPTRDEWIGVNMLARDGEI